MRRLLPVLLVLFGAVSIFVSSLQSAPKAYATTSSNLNFQARLETAAGAVAPDGNYNVEFKIYGDNGASVCVPSTGTNCTNLWTEDWLNNASNGIHTANGYLTASLGSITAFPSTINWDQQLYISMTVRGTGSCAFGSCTPADSAMLPYLKLTAVPYAFSAGQLQTTTSGASPLTGKLSITAPTVGSQTFVIQDQGVAGTFNILTAPSGSDGYVKLQGSTPGTAQTGNLNINGVGIFGSLQATSLDTASAVALGIGNSLATAINIGTNAGAHAITVGNVTGATGITEKVGTGNYSLDGVTNSTYTVGASTTTGTITIGGTAQTGDIVLGSSSGTNTVKIGNGAGGTTVNIANVATTGGVNIGTAITTGSIAIGNTGNTSTVVNGGTTATFTSGAAGTTNIGTTLTSGILNVGTALTTSGTLNLYTTAAGAGILNIATGATQTTALNIGTGAGAQTYHIADGAGVKGITLGSTNSTSSLLLQSGTGNLQIQTQGTGTLGIGNNAVAQNLVIGNVTGATGIAEKVGTGNYSLDGVTNSTYAIGASTTTGTITIGGTAQTGTITLGSSSGTNTVVVGNGAGATTVNVANVATTGAVSIGTAITSGSITIGNIGNTSTIVNGGTTTTLNAAAAGTVNVGTGVTSGIINIGTALTTSGTLNLYTTAAGAGTLNIATGATQTTAVQIGTGGGAQTLNFGTGAAAKTVGVGSATAGSSTTIQGATTKETISSTGDVIQTTTNSTTAFQVQNAAGTPIFLVDTATTANLVTNPGFEVNVTTGWTNVTATLTRNTTLGQYYHGQASMTVAVTTLGGGAQVTGFNSAITPAAYNFSFYALNSNAGALSIAVTGGSAPTCTLNSTAMVTTGFQRYFCSFTSTTTNVTAITIKSSTTGTFYIDGVQLTAGATVQPYGAQGAIQLRGIINSPATFQSTSNSTTAFQIQNSAGTNNLFIADTLNSRIGIGTATPAYPLDVVGDINTSTVYRVGGTSGTTTTCSGGQVMQNQVVTGGITTGGSCAAVAAAGTYVTLQASTPGTADTGNFNITGVGIAGSLQAGSLDTASAGTLSIGNNLATTVNIATNAVAHTIGIGTGAAIQGITIGSTNSTSSLLLQSGTGNLQIQTQGTGTLGIANNAVAQNVVIGNVTGATGIQEKVGTGNYSLDGVTNSTYAVGASTTTGTITIGGTAQTGNIVLGSSSGTNTVFIGNGAGGTTVNIANVATTGGVNIATAITTGSVTIGNIGNTSTVVNGGTTTTLNAAAAGTVNVGTGVTSGIVNIGTALTTSGTLNLYTTAAGAGILNIATGATQTTALNIGTGAGAQTYHIADGAGVKAITLGSTNSTSSLLLQSGTGNLQIQTQGTGTLGVGNNAVAQNLAIGNVTGATGISERVGTGNYSLDGVTNSTYVLGASTTTGTITIGGTAQTGDIVLGSSSGTNTVKIGNGAGATTVNVANVATTGAVNIGTAITSGSITIGNVGNTSTTVNGGTTTTLSAAATGTVNIGTNITSGIINLGVNATSGAGTLNIANAATQTTAVQVGTGSGAQTLNFGTGAAAKTVGVGSATAGSATTIQGATTKQVINSAGELIQTTTNSATAFQIQNAAGESVLLADTTTLNLVLNSSFEAGTTNWAAKGTTSLFTVDTSTANVYQGKQALEATVTAATSGMATSGGQAAFSTNILATTQYQLTFEAKCSGSFATLTYGRQDVAGTDVNSATTDTCGTTWKQYTAHWTTGGTITNPNIYINLGATTAGTLWVDAVSLVQTTVSAANAYGIGSIYTSGIFVNPAVFQTRSDSTTAFQIQSSTGLSVLNVDTANGSINLKSNFSIQNTIGQQIFGFDITTKKFAIGSALNATGNLSFFNSSNSNATTLSATTPTANRTINFPDASGTVCLDSSNCSGVGGYIVNGTSVQAANFYVQAATSGSVGAKIQANAAGSGDIVDFYNGAGTQVGAIASDGTVAFLQSGVTSGNEMWVSANSLTSGNGLVVSSSPTFTTTTTVSGNIIQASRSVTDSVPYSGGSSTTPITAFETGNSGLTGAKTSGTTTNWEQYVDPVFQDAYVLVYVYQTGTFTVPTSVTYDGVAMTLLKNTASGTFEAVYGLAHPRTGYRQVVVTWGATTTNGFGASAAFYDVASVGTALSTVGTGTSTNLTVNTATNALVVDAISIASSTSTPGAGQTTIFTANSILRSSYKAYSGATTNVSETIGVSTAYAYIALALFGTSSNGTSISSAVATFSSNCTSTTEATCQDFGDVVDIQQNNTDSGASALFIQNAGTGYGIQVGDYTSKNDQSIGIVSHGSASLDLISDVDNTTGEIGGAYINFSQDGAVTQAVIGLSQAAGTLPLGTGYSVAAGINGDNVGANALIIGQQQANPITFVTNSAYSGGINSAGTWTIEPHSTDTVALNVYASNTSAYVAQFENLNTSNTANGVKITLGAACTTLGTGDDYMSFYGNGSGVAARGGHISATGVACNTTNVSVAYKTTNSDYAEYFPSDPANMPQDHAIIGFTDASNNTTGAASNPNLPIVGAISDNPGFVGNDVSCPENLTWEQCDGNYAKYNNLVAMVGQVPVVVNASHGAIHVGDPIGLSGTPGVGAKLIGSGYIVGYAEGNLASGDGTIQVLIRPEFYSAPLQDNGLTGSGLQVTGDASINGSVNVGANMNVGGVATVGSLHVNGDAYVGGNISVHGNATVAGNLTVQGLANFQDILVAGHFTTDGTAPTAAVLTAAGSSNATVQISGNDTTGTITITVGDASAAASGAPAITGPSAGALAKLLFSKVFGKTPHILITANDASSAALQVYPSDISDAGFSLAVGATPNATTTYTFTYFVVQ